VTIPTSEDNSDDIYRSTSKRKMRQIDAYTLFGIRAVVLSSPHASQQMYPSDGIRQSKRWITCPHRMTSEHHSRGPTLLYLNCHATPASYSELTDTSTMRLTNAASLGVALRSNVGRIHNKLHIASSTYGVRSLTSGTYRVPKAFNEPNVRLFSKACPGTLQTTDSIIATL
jgi:hypothetical protein